MKDNTFEAKFKYGQGGDEWGKHGYEKLKHTRGDSFKKTKSKLKNAAFQSGGIDPYRINSVKILWINYLLFINILININSKPYLLILLTMTDSVPVNNDNLN